MTANPPTPRSWGRALRARRSGPARAGAFTLIEILIVVGIIGLTLTMGVPAFVRAFQKEGMRKAQSDLLEACQKARGAAIINVKPQELIIKPVERSFEVPGAFPLTIFPEDVSLGVIMVNDLPREQDDVIVVRFFPRGTSDEFIMVIRSERDGSRCTLSLDPVSALADISTGR